MEALAPIIARGALSYALLLAAVFAVGWGLLALVARAARSPLVLSITTAFVAGLMGFLGLAFFTAVVCTRGNTVLWLLPLLAGTCMLLARGEPAWAEALLPAPRRSSGRSPGPWLAAAAVLPFVLLGAATYRFDAAWDGGFAYRTTYFDHYLFRVMAHSLHRTGVETYFGLSALFDPTAEGPTPYHYLDLWLIAAAELTLPAPALEAVCLTVPAVLLCLVVLGLWAVMEAYATLSAARLALAPVVLAAGVLWWPALEQQWLTLGAWAFAGSLGYIDLNGIGGKEFPVVLSVGLPLLLLRVGAVRMAVASGAVIILADTTQAVSYGAAALVMAVYLWQQRRGQAWMPLVIATGAVLLYGLFYFVNSRLGPQPEVRSTFAVGAYFNELTQRLPTRVNTVLKMGLQIGLFVLPYVLLGTHSLRRGQWRVELRRAYLPLAAVIAIGTGLVLWDLTGPLVAGDSSQFYLDPSALFFLLLLGLLYVRAQSTRWPYVLLMVLIGASISVKSSNAIGDPYARPRPQHPAFMAELAAYQPSNPIGGYLKDSSDLKSPWQNYRKPGYFRTVGSLEAFFLPQYTATVFLNDPVAAYNEPGLWAQGTPRVFEELRRRQPFQRYWNCAVAADTAIALGHAQLCFIRRYGIGWILATPQVLVQPELSACLQRTLTDPSTGDRMLVMDSARVAASVSRRPCPCE